MCLDLILERKQSFLFQICFLLTFAIALRGSRHGVCPVSVPTTRLAVVLPFLRLVGADGAG